VIASTDVKNALVLPALFLFYLLLTLSLFATLDVLTLMESGLPVSGAGELPGGSGTAVMLIPYSLERSLPGACIVSLFLLFFRILRRPGSRLLTYMLLLTTVTLVLIFGHAGLAIISGNRESVIAPVPLPEARKLEPFADGVLYLGGISGTTVSQVVIAEGVSPGLDWNITYRPQAELVRVGETVAIDVGDRRVLLETSGRASHLQVPEWLGEGLTDYHILASDLASLAAENSRTFYLLSAAVAFVFIGTNVLSRLTRWPLFNLIVVFLVMRALLILYGFIRTEVVPEWQKVADSLLFVRILPPLVLFGLGTLLYLIDFLFVPFDAWNREISGDTIR
jgi:hypothetical protein